MAINETDASKDFQLSTHFSFFELTVTSNAALQEANRRAALTYLPTLKALASVLEMVRGGRPIVVNSAFRSYELNKKTAGASPTSQHPLGQAADFHRHGEDPRTTFLLTLGALKAGRIPFGQLIDESAQRDYGVVRWVHLSLGPDFWKPERCGEVLRKWDEDGKAKYQMLEKVEQSSWTG